MRLSRIKLMGRLRPKSEIRSPKSERNPNSEIRIGKTRRQPWEQRGYRDSDFGIRVRISFGLRHSGFGFLSDFGLRISDLVSHSAFFSFSPTSPPTVPFFTAFPSSSSRL